jgi:hypothetical protein
MDFPGLEDRAHELEGMIRRIKDVISVRVMFSADGLIEEVHVLASGGRSAKQLVRDIESALMAQGIAIDHKKISVAQLSPEEPAEGGNDRVRILGYSIGLAGRTAEARVKLGWQGTPVEGQAQGPATSTGRIRVAAEASLRAVQQCVRTPVSLYLEDCSLVTIGSRRAVTVIIAEIGDDGPQSLMGCCLVRQDEAESAVRATLDALNRRLTVWSVAPGAQDSKA